MGSKTGISWTNATWNAVRGCSRVDEGCIHCYAETVAYRFSANGLPYAGLITLQNNGEPRWNGNIMLVEEHLLDPLKWQKPRKIFVNSMSDFFHPAIPDSYRDKMMAVIALSPQHIFQVLTKREDEMYAYLSDKWRAQAIHEAIKGIMGYDNPKRPAFNDSDLPLKNLWLLVSVNDQKSANKRVPILLNTPAAIRGVSYEPATGPVDFSDIVVGRERGLSEHVNALRGHVWQSSSVFGDGAPLYLDEDERPGTHLDWIIFGGESGHNARPCNALWAMDVQKQCEAAEVAFYFKQYGANPLVTFISGKGDNPDEWPAGLWRQEYPI